MPRSRCSTASGWPRPPGWPGRRYPVASLDKAWRLLVFGAHHDAITGTEGDQVYLDLLAGWREAYERGAAARADAASLPGRAGRHGGARPRGAGQPSGHGGARAVVVFNTLAWPRSGHGLDLRWSSPLATAVACG